MRVWYLTGAFAAAGILMSACGQSSSAETNATIVQDASSWARIDAYDRVSCKTELASVRLPMNGVAGVPNRVTHVGLVPPNGGGAGQLQVNGEPLTGAVGLIAELTRDNVKVIRFEQFPTTAVKINVMAPEGDGWQLNAVTICYR